MPLFFKVIDKQRAQRRSPPGMRPTGSMAAGIGLKVDTLRQIRVAFGA
jgi:hypothetical protein